MAARTGARSRREARLALAERTRPQSTPGDLHYAFAPLKHARLDFMVQKAVEMGVRLADAASSPAHTQVARVNLERMRANAIEAAEQCGIYFAARDRRTGTLSGMARPR